MAVHDHIHLRKKKSAKIEMKELMKGHNLRNLHMPKLPSIKRFKMTFESHRVYWSMPWHFQSLISASNQKSTPKTICSLNPHRTNISPSSPALLRTDDFPAFPIFPVWWFPFCIAPWRWSPAAACCTEEGILFTAVSRTTATCSKVSDTLKAQCWCRQHLFFFRLNCSHVVGHIKAPFMRSFDKSCLTCFSARWQKLKIHLCKTDLFVL